MLLALLAALFYAACYSAIKSGLIYAPPLRFAALRALIGGLFLLSALAILKKPLIPPRRLFGFALLLSIIGPVVGFAAMFMASSHSGVALSSVIGNTGPLLVIVFAALFLGERITRGKLVALVLGLAGASLIAVSGANSSSKVDRALVIFPLLAAASTAAESMLVKVARPGPAVFQIAAWQYLLASLPLLGLSMWQENAASIEWNRSFVLVLLILAAGSTAAATSLWYWLVDREEVSRLSLVLFVVPIAGLGLGVAVFGERLGTLQLAGIALILLGVVGAALEPRRGRQ